MSLIIAENGGGDFELCPAGTFTARCYRVVDLGTQKIEFNGEVKWQPKILIQWELPTELMEDGRPFSVSKRFTASLHEKANLRQVLEAWHGKPFTPEELKGFNISKILGMPCIITVVHEPSRDGSKTYANIATVSAPMKGMVVPEGVNKPSMLDFDHWDKATFETLGKGLQKSIMASQEYKMMMERQGKMPSKQGGAFDDLESDIPF
jgi:hypothetical protein